MAENLPVSFAIPGESAIASYNWEDFLTNIGFVNFYGAGTQDSVGIAYQFINQVVYSNPSTKGDFTTSAGGSAIQGSSATNYIEFVSNTFKKPATIEGNARIKIRWAVGRTGQAGTGGGPAVLTLYHNTTSLGSVTTTTLEAANGAISIGTNAVLIAIPKTRIKIGDTIKLRVGCGFSESYHYLHISFDPTSEANKLEVQMPFKIEI